MELLERLEKYLADVMCVKYNGIIDYTVEPDKEYYELRWQLNPDDNTRSLILQGQFSSEEAFGDYVIREIKTKRFHLYKNFRVIKVNEN